MIDDIEERILLEQEGLLAVNKPYDIPSTGRNLEDDDCLQFWLMKRFGGMVWAVHQLDADTTGVNLFVREKKLVKFYKKYLEASDCEKTYLAIVHGHPTWQQKEVVEPIGKLDERNLGISPQGKFAHSQFRVLGRGHNYSLLEVRIFTGRTHQIRIHLNHLGHSLVGEEWYRESPCTAHVRQALHCQRICFPELKLEIKAPVAKDLQNLLISDAITGDFEHLLY